MQKILMGNDAIAWGLINSGVEFASGYPGTPSSEILASFQKIRDSLGLQAYAEWATNEKVGFEVAYAASMSGRRACATMKQVGLNVASDALMSAAYIGNKGGFLLVCADDPGFHSSQTEQDSRSFAKFARIPVLDPSTPQEAYTMVKKGLELSEFFETPVMLRSTMRVSHSREICEIDEPSFEREKKEAGFERDIKRWAAVPREGRLRQGIEMLERIESLKAYNWKEFIEPLASKLTKKPTLILASGVAYVYAKEAVEEQNLEADVLKIHLPYPLPSRRLEELFEGYERVIVFEESYPCMEEQLNAPNLHGKLTHEVSEIDELGKKHLLDTLAKLGITQGSNPYVGTRYEKELPKRPPNLCPGCPHRDMFYAITKVFKKKKSLFPSDIGCYTLGLNQGAIDTVLCMGGSISVASGLSLANPDKAIVATIGDSTFVHGGIPPLINAVYQKHRFVLVVLDNSVVAMTGRQSTPEGSPDVDILKIVQGCGAEAIEYRYTPKLKESVNFFKQVKARYEESDKPIVVVVRQFCVLDKERAKLHLPKEFATVDKDKCVACDHCLTEYKCPSMSYGEDGKVEIDPFLCAGCGACLDGLCPTDAFTLISKGAKA